MRVAARSIFVEENAKFSSRHLFASSRHVTIKFDHLPRYNCSQASTNCNVVLNVCPHLQRQDAAAIAGPTSSSRAIKKSFKVPRFFKRILLEQTRWQPVCSPDMVDKLESGSSVSSCKVHEIVQGSIVTTNEVKLLCANQFGMLYV
jgi:hypothetical protein